MDFIIENGTLIFYAACVAFGGFFVYVGFYFLGERFSDLAALRQRELEEYENSVYWD